jgi:Imm-5 like putative immunity protein
MSQSRSAGGHAMAAARVLSGAARYAAFAAGQAGAVAHVAAHELGGAAYAIKAARAAGPPDDTINLGRLECGWQREQLPEAIRDLVLDDQLLRNEICCSPGCPRLRGWWDLTSAANERVLAGRPRRCLEPIYDDLSSGVTPFDIGDCLGYFDERNCPVDDRAHPASLNKPNQLSKVFAVHVRGHPALSSWHRGRKYSADASCR